MNNTPIIVPLNLVGLNGNAFYLLGAFRRAALRAGYTADEIAPILDDARSGDYDHLLEVLVEHCEDTDDDDE